MTALLIVSYIFIGLICLILVLLSVRLFYRFTSGSYDITESQKDKVFLITGASSGIGYEAAKELYRHNATVVMLCRNLTKAKSCINDIEKEVPSSEGQIDIIECDLVSLDNVRSCAKTILQSYPKINVLLNNAGQGGEPGSVRTLTSDHLEHTMAANYFGHFLLTYLLLDRLLETQNSRVVSLQVSSLMHRFCRRFTMDSLNFDRESYRSIEAYSRSKLAQILHTRHLAKLIKSRGLATAAYSLCPGAVKTDIHRSNGPVFRQILRTLFTFFKTPSEGAQTSIHLCVAPDIQGLSGGYFSDCKPIKPSATASDENLAEALWKKSCELVGVSPNIDHGPDV